ncbi:MAG: 50S ribosomal protein L17 [Phycisphaerales bacterium]|jgi:large subunit ribosomal protein L17|nr:50S ribosomal protein L17 [Phycisphaerales bacterium]
MRNRIQGKQLSRDSEHRRAMLRNLAAGLFEHGQVETTMPKAKAVQPFIEKIITAAKKGGLNARRQIEARLNDRKIHAWVADPNVPDSRKENAWFDLPDASDIEFNRYGELRKAPRLVQHIMTAVADRFRDRDGGYTRIVRTGRHRLGDGGDIVVLQLVGEEEGAQIGGGTSTRRKQADRRTAFAASLRKDQPAEGEADEPIEAEAEVAADEGVQEAAADAPETGVDTAAESSEATTDDAEKTEGGEASEG